MRHLSQILAHVRETRRLRSRKSGAAPRRYDGRLRCCIPGVRRTDHWLWQRALTRTRPRSKPTQQDQCTKKKASIIIATSPSRVLFCLGSAVFRSYGFFLTHICAALCGPVTLGPREVVNFRRQIHPTDCICGQSTFCECVIHVLPSLNR